jgi:single-strand DNA-binding protein
MASVNRVVLLGNLTRDPELRHTQGGTAICELRLAVNDREKGSDGEWRDRAGYYDIIVWGKQAENCAQYLTKGRAIALDGKLRFEEWEKDGQRRSRVKIVADNVQFISDRRGQDDGAPQSDFNPPGDVEFKQPEADFSTASTDADPDSEIPF